MSSATSFRVIERGIIVPIRRSSERLLESAGRRCRAGGGACSFDDSVVCFFSDIFESNSTLILTSETKEIPFGDMIGAGIGTGVAREAQDFVN